MAVLVTGGAGYIGSHVVQALLEAGEEVVVLDNLSSLGRSRNPRRDDIAFYCGSVQYYQHVKNVFEQHDIDDIIHLAAMSHISYSFLEPSICYENNVGGLLGLTRAMAMQNKPRLIFASSSSVYGKNDLDTVDEDAPLNPASPYAHSKLITEQMMKYIAPAYNIEYVAFRFFNVAGTAHNAEVSADRLSEPPLIPTVLRTARGQNDAVKIFGNDYPTVDGTCVRDYVHVVDIVDAILKALEYLRNGGKSTTLNLGSGKGTSIKQIIKIAENVSGRHIKTPVEGRREGDIPMQIASIQRAHDLLGWSPVNSSPEQIISDAWNWKRQVH